MLGPGRTFLAIVIPYLAVLWMTDFSIACNRKRPTCDANDTECLAKANITSNETIVGEVTNMTDIGVDSEASNSSLADGTYVKPVNTTEDGKNSTTKGSEKSTVKEDQASADPKAEAAKNQKAFGSLPFGKN